MLKIILTALAAIMSTATWSVTCTTAANCDDGQYCNGREICVIPAGQTVGQCHQARNFPCPPQLGMSCNERTNACEKVMCKNDRECIDQDPCDGKRVCTQEDGLDTFNNYNSVWGCKKVSERSCPEDRVCQPNRSMQFGFQCVTQECVNPDKDRDGRNALACGGDDCNDDDAAAFPGNVEVCDNANHDEDCNPETFGNKDMDRDGHFDIRCCNKDAAGKEFCGEDCDDTNRAMFPGMQSCTRDLTHVFVCGRGVYQCGEGNTCALQPNGLGVCIPQK